MGFIRVWVTPGGQWRVREIDTTRPGASWNVLVGDSQDTLVEELTGLGVSPTLAVCMADLLGLPALRGERRSCRAVIQSAGEYEQVRLDVGVESSGRQNFHH